MHTAKVTSKGQVTIPKGVRRLLSINSGDRLAFEIEGNGGLRLSRLPSADPPLKGLLAKYGRGPRVDDEQIRSALAQRAAKKYAR